MSMLEVQNLSVRFGSAVIVNDVSFSVQDGDCSSGRTARANPRS